MIVNFVFVYLLYFCLKKTTCAFAGDGSIDCVKKSLIYLEFGMFVEKNLLVDVLPFFFQFFK